MLLTMKNEARLNWKDWLIYPAFLLAGFLLGQLIIGLVFRFDPDPGEWFPLGSIMALFFSALAVLIYDALGASLRLQLALSMGRARKTMIAAQFVLCAARMCLLLLCTVPLVLLEQASYQWFYATYENAFDLLGYFRLPYVLCYVLLLPCAAIIASGVLGKYRKRGGLILYLLFMFCCIGLPRIIESASENPNSIWAKLGTLLASMPVAVWLPLGLLVLLGLMAAAIHMLMTMRVEI